jgi:hypothetical protein
VIAAVRLHSIANKIACTQLSEHCSAIHGWLVRRPVPYVNQSQGVGLVAGAQVCLSAGGHVLAIINAGAKKQNEPVFHMMPIGSES